MVDHHPGFDGPVHPDLEVRGTKTGRLPASGRPHDAITLERNRDYPADSDLCFATGSSETRVRLTGAGQNELRALLTGQRDLENLRASAMHLARQGVPEEHGRGNANLAVELAKLVNESHAAGYRLAIDDQRETAQQAGYMAEFLSDLLQETYRTEKLADGEIGPGPNARALERVIALLGP